MGNKILMSSHDHSGGARGVNTVQVKKSTSTMSAEICQKSTLLKIMLSGRLVESCMGCDCEPDIASQLIVV
jgi:hypothetical protein